jgi:hypothetical protein
MPFESADWRCRAGTLEWSCWTTAAHVAHDLLAYAGQLAARPDDAYLPFDLKVRDDASPRDLLRIVTGSGRLLSSALAASDPSLRAWHWGPTDPSGFALWSTGRADLPGRPHITSWILKAAIE